jgi:hypothetical protein
VFTDTDFGVIIAVIVALLLQWPNRQRFALVLLLGFFGQRAAKWNRVGLYIAQDPNPLKGRF